MKKIYIRKSNEIIRICLLRKLLENNIDYKCFLNRYNSLFSVSIYKQQFIENKRIINNIIRNIKRNFPEFEIKIL